VSGCPLMHHADGETFDRFVDHVAERVLAVVTEALANTPSASWVDAAGLGRIIGRSPHWVREHADLLGARRLGDGPKARYLFNVAEAIERLPSCEGTRGSVKADSPAKRPNRRRRKARSSGTDAPLLPIRGSRG
jgi:hypothetical protein